MTTDAFHPDLRRAAHFIPRSAVGPRRLPLVRFLTGLGARRHAPGVETVDLGEISVRVHRPAAGAPQSSGLLWIHGGGMVIGSAKQDDTLCRRYAAELGVLVTAVDYRLAPEHPFPTPLEDCYSALVWLAGQPGIDPTRIAIAGASAGGGLAAGLALLARQRGDVAPCFQVLAYPMLDDRTATRTDLDERSFRAWNNRANRFGWEAYTARRAGAADVSELAAPARAQDLDGLPPAWLGVGSLDLFCDEGLRYAERLAAAGVPCEVDLVEGAFHGFDAMVPKAAVSRDFQSAQIAALGRQLDALR
jgi:acetyl esterase/lipase